MSKEEIFISLCTGDKRRISSSYFNGHNLFLLSAFLLAIITLLSIFPMPFYGGAAVAGPGISTAADTNITLVATSNETTVILGPGTGFNLSAAADTAAYDVTTNNFTGYTINITAEDDNKTLVKTDDNTKYIESITSPVLQTNFNTSALINHWGIKPNKYRSGESTIVNTNTIFPSPDTAGLVLDVTTAANSSTANRYSVALGAMVDENLPAGIYTRATTINVIPNPIYYTISYDKNTTDTNVIDIPTAQNSSTTETGVALSNLVPQRPHYIFRGWCQGSTSVVDSADVCSGTVFQPGDIFGIDQTTTNITTLYAMWEADAYSCSAEYRLQNADGTYPTTYTSLGEIDPAVKYGNTCSCTSIQDSAYYVNQTASQTVSSATVLQLDIPRTTFTLNVTGNTTNLATITGSGTYRWGEEVPISATEAIHGEFTGWTQTAGIAGTILDSTELSTTFTMPASNATVEAGSNALSAMQNLSLNTCSTTPTTVYDSRDDKRYTIRKLTDGNCWMTQNLRFTGTTIGSTDTNINTTKNLSYEDLSAGNSTLILRTHSGLDGNGDPTVWYNYAAASAGTITGESNSNTATYDICPSGWEIPNVAESIAITSDVAAFNPVPGGRWVDGELEPSTVPNGVYWTSTPYSDWTNYVLFYNGSAGTMGVTSTMDSSGRRYDGFFVRCVMKQTMQDFSAEDVAAMSTGDVRSLRDIRDDQDYIVAKLADGKVWMIQNLKLGKTTSTLNLSSSDSNVSSFTLTGKSSDGKFTSTTVDGVSYQNNNPQYYCTNDYGCYYNWYTATAGSGTTAKTSGEATSSICPSGWKLPSGGPNSDMSKLYSNYNSYAAMVVSPTSATENVGGLSKPGFLLSGYYSTTGAGGLGVNGSYATRTAASAERLYGMYIYTSTVDINYGLYKYGGFAVRCVYGGDTMQDFSNKDVVAMTEGETKNLLDARDGQEYTVAKINGDVWMTRNLAIGCDGTGNTYGANATGLSLNSGSSNIASAGWSTPTANLGSNDYDNPRMKCHETYGAFYNFAAASAGTVTGSSNSNDAVYDICPSGWHLPTSNEISSIAGSGYVTEFAPTNGGFFRNGGRDYGTNGYYFGSTASSATSRYIIFYNNGQLSRSDGNNVYRNYGLLVRCVKAPHTYSIIMDNNNATTAGTTTAKATQDSNIVQDNSTGTNITNPQREYTVSGFSTSSNNASGATVSSSTTLTSRYSFTGWYTAASGGNLIINTNSTLEPSTSYTDTYGNWTGTPIPTLYAQWDNTVSAAKLTLPIITKTGFTCGWSTSSSTSTIEYTSGQPDVVPTQNTILYGVCVANTYDLAINFAGTGVSSVQVRTASGTGGTLKGTVSTSGGHVSGLTYNTAYYLYPVYTSGYELSSWANTGGVGTLSSTSAANPTFRMGAGNGIVRITGKRTCVNVSGTMQDFTGTANYCTTSGTLTDSRDSKTYTVAKINNQWWMTQNLCYKGDTGSSSGSMIMKSATSNIQADKTLSYGSLTEGNAYNTARIRTAVSSIIPSGYTVDDIGVWYNYAAATAGTITGDSNSNNATYDICPKGWRLPSNSEQAGITSQSSAYSPVTGGRYSGGSLGNNGTGYWYSSTTDTTTGRYGLSWNGTSLVTGGGLNRRFGYYVRCIHNQ